MNTNAYFQQAANGIADYIYQELKLYPAKNYRIVRTMNGPRVITLALDVNPTYARKIMAMGEQLSMAARLEKGYSLRIERGSQGLLVLEVPKPESLWFNVSINALPRRTGITATMGIDGDHKPALVNFDNYLTAHILIAGTTGSGKTNAARLLTYDLANQNQPEELGLILIDTAKNGRGWNEFRTLPHLINPIITEEDTALKALTWALGEIDSRSKQNITKPKIFVGIDEVQVLLEKEQFEKPLVRLISIGREFGIHTALLTQNPTAKILGDATVKRNLSVRLVGKVDSPEAAKVATGLSGTGAERLAGTGDMLLIQPADNRRITTALVTEKDISRLPKAESTKQLDLDYFEDSNQVIEATKAIGRPTEPLKPEVIARAMIESDISQRQLYKEFGIGFSKAKEVIEFAKNVLIALDKLGYEVQRKSATKVICNEIDCNR